MDSTELLSAVQPGMPATKDTMVALVGTLIRLEERIEALEKEVRDLKEYKINDMISEYNWNQSHSDYSDWDS